MAKFVDFFHILLDNLFNFQNIYSFIMLFSIVLHFIFNFEWQTKVWSWLENLQKMQNK